MPVPTCTLYMYRHIETQEYVHVHMESHIAMYMLYFIFRVTVLHRISTVAHMQCSVPIRLDIWTQYCRTCTRTMRSLRDITNSHHAVACNHKSHTDNLPKLSRLAVVTNTCTWSGGPVSYPSDRPS